MNTFYSVVPSVSMHPAARKYLGRDLVERLIEDTTLPQVLMGLQSNAQAMPALTWYEGDALIEQYSYHDLLQQVRTMAHWFAREHGVIRSDRVVVLSSNSPEAYVAHLALMSIGAVTVPVSNTESLRVLQTIVDKVAPRILVSGRDVASELESVERTPTHALPRLPLVPPAQEIPFAWPAQEVLPDDPAVILFTSGTTSAPKGVCLSHYNLLVNAEGLTRTHHLAERRVHMCILPLFHANAFGFSMITSVYSGNHVVLCSGLPGAAIWSILREQRVHVISLVPEIIRVLAAIPVLKSTLPDLQYVVSAAAPLPKAVAQEFMLNTGIDIHQGYGLSECVNFAATIPWHVGTADLKLALEGWAVPSIGTPVFGCAIDIVRPDGTLADKEEAGEIAISGHTVMLGYWDDVPATQAALSDGYLRTGDLGFFSTIDGCRYFFVTGRKKEIIIRYGENLSPLAIEAELDALRSMGRFAVTGFANEMAGEEIGLYMLIHHTQENERKVMEKVRGCSARYRPRVIVFGTEPIPATPTGKVKRSLLAQRFQSYKNRIFGNDPIVGKI